MTALHTTNNPSSDDIFEKAKQLKVVIISDAAPSRNGVGTFYVDLVAHLKKHLKHIEIMSPIVEGEKWKAGLVFPLPGDKTQKLCFPNPVKMKRELQAIQPDLILIATPGVYALVGTWLAKKLGIPAILGFHTSFEKITELYWKNSIAGLIVQKYFTVSHRYLFKHCPLILANSEEMIAQAKRIGAQNTCTVNTPIAAEFTDPKLQAYSGKIERILFAGRLAPEKNIEALLGAIKALPNMHFSIAGDGPLRDLIETHTETCENLSYLGWLDRNALREQMDQHDALVLPSHFESFGTIALEAMARQRLVITSEDCGIVEWEQYRAGLTVIDSTLTNTLRALSNLDDAARLQLAEQAHAITQDANQETLREWCNLLLESAKKM